MIRQIESKLILLALPAVKQMVGLSTATIYQRMAKGLFPKPVGISGGIGKRWVEHEVQQWIADRIAERDADVM